MRLFHIDKPTTGGGLGVDLPIDRFDADLNVRRLEVLSGKQPRLLEGGAFRVRADGNEAVVEGWGLWNGISSKRSYFLTRRLRTHP